VAKAAKSSETPTRRRPELPVVVAVGASNRGYADLESLFSHLPKRPGVAFVVTFSQADGLSPEAVAETAGRCSNLAAEVVVERLRPQANRIYVAPSDQTLVVEDGELVLHRVEQSPGHRGSIDSLITSLAQSLKDRAIGVLLPGVAPDGVAGVTALKENGGLALAVGGSGLAVRDAPKPIDPVGLVDFVLSADQVGGQIAAYLKHLASLAKTEAAKSRDAAVQANLSRVAGILRTKTGHDFHGYKQNTFVRRVERRMQVLQVRDMEAYIEALRTAPDEVNHLFQDLLIGVTQFFRDKAEFALLEREVIPKLFEGKGADDHVRVWVLGCATGEEAYSIGILLREHMATLEVAPLVQIFATDIDGRALSMARSGRYPASIAKDLTPERLARWFAKEGATYLVAKELREMCIFSQHNVIKDAPFSRTDMVSCRNLLIYLTSELQERVIPLFHFSLRPGGFLFLGTAENTTRHAKLFSPVDRRHRVFRRLEVAARVLPDFPLAVGRRARGDVDMSRHARAKLEPGLGRRAERIAESYAPAYVLVDDQFDVLHFSGRTGRFLEPAAGAATLNLLNLVRRELRIDLRAALQEAASQHHRVQVERLQVDVEGLAGRVDLIVEPLLSDEHPVNFVVLFRDAGPVTAVAGPEESNLAPRRDEHLQRMESELRFTKERLQATIEELESTNEELKSSNEEYQSINEELQSANEEMETSKEELQSVNEELQTVNGELGHRVQELARSNSDLKNLLENTQIATLFLDNGLRIQTFTPSASDVFHLLDTDLGRPIGHIVGRVAYPELQEDARRVLRTLTPIEREVAGEDPDTRYLAKVLPYRSIDNYIGGVILTFADISAAVRAKAALQESESRLRMILESATDYAIISLDAQRNITGWNPGAVNIFGWREDEVLGKPADLVFTPEDRKAGAPEAEMRAALRKGRGADDRWHVRRDGTQFWASGVLMPFSDPSKGFVKILHDRTQEREAAERQKLLTAELQHRVKNTLAVVRSIASRTLETTEDLDDFSAHFDGRLRAMSRTQGVLTRTGEGRIDLEELVREELLTHAAHEGEQVEISGPAIALKERAAEIFALALHELATNAVKYGALAQENGRVAISWRVLQTAHGGRLSLDWRETGVPALDPKPSRTGFGRDLIERGLPYELGAATSLEFLPGGVRCTVELPLDQDGEVSVDPARSKARR
jgi:two-component system CheB/CheR fusion protein